MSVASTTALITTAFGDLGTGVLAVLGLLITIGVAYLVFRIGWRKLMGAVK